MAEGRKPVLTECSPCAGDYETGIVVQSAIDAGANNPDIKMKIEKKKRNQQNPMLRKGK